MASQDLFWGNAHGAGETHVALGSNVDRPEDTCWFIAYDIEPLLYFFFFGQLGHSMRIQRSLSVKKVLRFSQQLIGCETCGADATLLSGFWLGRIFLILYSGPQWFETPDRATPGARLFLAMDGSSRRRRAR